MVGTPGTRPLSRQAELAAICGLAVLASVPRALPVLGSGFPLLDGGLFSVMIRDLLANGFVPPAVTSYNGGSIPFIYPPLAIYLGAGLASLGIDVTQILRWVPLGLSVATVPAVYIKGVRYDGTIKRDDIGLALRD